MHYYKYIRIFLILIPIAILAFLFYRDFNPSGYLKVDYDFCRADPFVSQFSPHGRVLGIERFKPSLGGHKICTQTMAIDPVYFDVRLSQRYDEARIKLWYRKNDDTPLQIGPLVNSATWQWQLKDINYYSDKDGWQFGLASYDLTGSEFNRNTLRWLISSSGLDMSGERIIFKRLEIEFLKSPLTRANWQARVKDWLKFFFAHF